MSYYGIDASGVFPYNLKTLYKDKEIMPVAIELVVPEHIYDFCVNQHVPIRVVTVQKVSRDLGTIGEFE